MQGKIKGRGTQPLENLVCTWGWRGTRQWTAACRESAQSRIGIGESAYFGRQAALALLLQPVVGQHHLRQVHPFALPAEVQQGQQALEEDGALFRILLRT